MKDRIVRLRSVVRLYEGSGKRQFPIRTGYTPAFMFINESFVAGSIELIGFEELHPGNECEAVLRFIHTKYLGDTNSFPAYVSFYEGPFEVGRASNLKEI